MLSWSPAVRKMIAVALFLEGESVEMIVLVETTSNFGKPDARNEVLYQDVDSIIEAQIEVLHCSAHS